MKIIATVSILYNNHAVLELQIIPSIFRQGIRENCEKCNVYTIHNYVRRRVQGTFIDCLKSTGYRLGTEPATTDMFTFLYAKVNTRRSPLSAVRCTYTTCVSCSQTTQMVSLANYTLVMKGAFASYTLHRFFSDATL